MLRQRIITALVAGALLLVVLFAVPAMAARLVIAAVILLAAWEWTGFLSLRAAAVRTGYVVLIATLLAALEWLLGRGLIGAPALLIVAMLWWTAAFVWIFFYPTPVPRALAAVAGVFVLLPAWLALDLVYLQSPAQLLFMLVIIWSADVGAYFAGRRFGRVKLAPRVSPGKTWEGVIGGLLLVGVLAGLGAWVSGFEASVLVPFCVAVALVSIVGDLTVSVFKRSVGMKDSGTLFPGHGGLLDRIDSVAAGSPLFALGIAWAGL